MERSPLRDDQQSLLRHLAVQKQAEEDLHYSEIVKSSSHADNCLTRVNATEEAEEAMATVDGLQQLLTQGGMDSCYYKVFIGTHINGTQTPTDAKSWRYVDTTNNPAEGIIMGLPLLSFREGHRWLAGLKFLLHQPDQGQEPPGQRPEPAPDEAEMEKAHVAVTYTNVHSHHPCLMYQAPSGSCRTILLTKICRPWREGRSGRRTVEPSKEVRSS